MSSEAISVEVECAHRLHPTPEYVALEDELRAAGFDPTYRPPVEERAADTTTLVIALYVVDKLTGAVLDRLAGVVVDWARTHLRPLLRQRGVTDAVVIPIYGPDGEVLSEVTVPSDDA